MNEPDVLPEAWFARADGRDDAGKARVVCDYIGGMTDRFAIDEHRRLYRLDNWNG
jgi:dGTPase